MKPMYNVTRQAAADLDDIAAYTLANWGVRQMAVYMEKLAERFAWLAEHPDIGRERHEIAPGYRSFVEGAHVIFYLVRDQSIDIIGVLHQSSDLTASLGPRL